MGQLQLGGEDGVDDHHRSGLVGRVEGDGHIVGVADGAVVKDKGAGGVGVGALRNAGRHAERPVAHVHYQLPVGEHRVHRGGGFRKGLALVPEVGVELPQIVQRGFDGRLDRVVVCLHILELLPAAQLIDDVAHKGAAGKVREGGVGDFAGIFLAEFQQLLGGSRRLRCDGAVVKKDHLSLGVGRFVPLDRHAEVVKRLRVLQIDVGFHVWQLFGEGAVQQAVVLGRVEVFAVDPDHVDAAGLAAGLLFARELGEDVVDVHPHHLQRNVIVLLDIVGDGGVQPVVAVFVAAPAVKGDGGAARSLDNLVPLGGAKVKLLGPALFLAAAVEGKQQGESKQKCE